MHCPQCEHANPEGMKFCGECGARLVRLCSKCGFANLPANKFCGECGQSLEVRAPEPRLYSPDSYTPKYLAERILASKAAIEGERKQVTVLFSDLKSSMEFVADRDPEDAQALLDAVVTRMMESVHRYEGTVNNVMGDGIMALFGAPLALEDHALRACYAAIAMQEAVRAYAKEARRRYGVDVNIRVGLNSGEVVVRAIGSDLSIDYSAIGQTTHLASRLEQFAQPGTICLAADTLRLAEGFLQVESLGPIPLKGLAEPVEVYELRGATSGRTRFQVTAAGGLSRFVGRQSELESLQGALDKARHGHGQVFATVAEAGVGKSRLYWEFNHSQHTKDCLVIESGSVSYGKAVAYRPVIDLLKVYFNIGDTDDQRRIREKITGKILALDETLVDAVPPILSLLEVPSDVPTWSNLDSTQRRQRTLAGVKQVLLREAQVQPLVLVFEDLHWIDTETQALLDSLVESLPGAPVLLLVNYRPEYEHGWSNKTYYTRLTLDPLSIEGAKELLQAILGDDSTLGSLKELLIERTQRNAFYLEECVQTLIESGALAGGPGAYHLSGEISSIQVPATVQAILAARMDRLPPEQKQLLQSASVIGVHVPYTLLSAIAGMSAEDLHRGLASLQAAEFLYETSLFPEREFTFKHALTHEVTYASLTRERRRALHAAVVSAIEEQGRELDERIELLAYHAYEGEVWEKAVGYLRQAGERAMSRSVFADACKAVEHAIEALKHLPENTDTIIQAIDLRLLLRNALVPHGEAVRVLPYLHEAQRLAEQIGDRHRLCVALMYTCANLCRLGGISDHALEIGVKALDIAETLKDLKLLVNANYYMGLLFYSMGSYEKCINRQNNSASMLKGDLLHEKFGAHYMPSINSRVWMTWSYAELGDFPNGETIAEEAIEISETSKSPYSIAMSMHCIGYLNIRLGDFERAVAYLERGLSLCKETNINFLLHWFMPVLGYAYTHSGRLDEGISLTREGIDRAKSQGLWGDQSFRVGLLGEEYLIAGRMNDANQTAVEAFGLSREHRERGFEAWALRLLGEIHSHPDAFDAETAEDYFRQALAIATELGMRPLVAHCKSGLGTLCARAERQEMAREQLAVAADMYRGMKMTYWLEKTDEALASVP